MLDLARDASFIVLAFVKDDFLSMAGDLINSFDDYKESDAEMKLFRPRHDRSRPSAWQNQQSISFYKSPYLDYFGGHCIDQLRGGVNLIAQVVRAVFIHARSIGENRSTLCRTPVCGAEVRPFGNARTGRRRESDIIAGRCLAQPREVASTRVNHEEKH